MVREITLNRAGGSASATIPKDMLNRYHLGPGDTVFAVETPQGVLLTPFNPATQAALEAYVEVARDNREALAALAKL